MLLKANALKGFKLDCLDGEDSELKVHVKLTREAIKASPAYTDEALLSRSYESGLFRHYGRDGYWAHETDRPTSTQP